MALEHLDTFIAFAVVMAGVSLLITILTQMISALLGMRGTNLKWGIKTLLSSIDPNISKHAEIISERVLHHPLISDSIWSKYNCRLINRWKLASSIRVNELVDVLRRLVAAEPPLAQQAQQPDSWQEALSAMLSRIDAAAAERAEKATNEIQQLSPQLIEKMDKLLPQLVSRAQKAMNDIELQFDSIMDRISQRFTVHMRIWTVIFSVIMAFAFHLDAFSLITKLSSDSELRASLITNAEAITQQANKMIGTTHSPIGSAYVEAMKQLKEQDPLAKQALGEPPAFQSFNDGETWLRMQLKDSDQTDALIKKYKNLVQSALKTEIEKLKDQAIMIKNELSKTKFQLVPDPYHYPWWDFWTGSFKINSQSLKGLEDKVPDDVLKKLESLKCHEIRGKDKFLDIIQNAIGVEPTDKYFSLIMKYADVSLYWTPNLHFWGILSAAALLSVGAPFWFNILKTLANLRPILANKQEKEQKKSLSSA